MSASHRTCLTYALAAGLLLTLAGCGGGGAAYTQGTSTGTGLASLALNNRSNEPIVQVYMSPVAQSTWGPELLSGRTLAVGQAFTLSDIAPGKWDIRVVDRSGHFMEFRNETLDPGGAYFIDISTDGWNAQY